jgi:NAD(P)H-nitrite reductase large subunit
MSDTVIIEDVMLDDESAGLAENFVPVEPSFTTVVSSDDEMEPDETVYFGLDLPLGDIGEVCAKVLSCEEKDDVYTLKLEILELDDRYVVPLTQVLKGEMDESQADGGPDWALGLKQTNGTFATLVNLPAGLLTGEQIEKIAEVTKQGSGLAKLTHAQRIVLLLKPEQVATVAEDLASVDLRVGVLHSGVRNIRGCCGALCQFSQGVDGLAKAIEIDKALYGRPMKFDIKIAVSDCMRNCMESYCVDIGLIGTSGKYNVFVGGAASSIHYKALKLASSIAPDDVVETIEKILQWYENNAKDGERLHKTLIRLGMDEANKRNIALFNQVESVFDGLDVGYNVSKQLTRNLARALTVQQMKKELELS